MERRKSKSVGRNAVLNAFKTLASIMFTLVTYPYAFRVLHAKNIGDVNYSNSIIVYFSVLAMLGVSNYAIREGAKIRHNKEELNKFVSQVFTINIVSTILAYLGLVVLLIIVEPLREYVVLIGILSTTIAFNTFSIDWVNIIHEDYMVITVRTLISQLVSLILLFTCVKDENDVLKYAIITVLGPAIVCISNWIYCRKYVRIKLTRKVELKKHIKPIMLLFANTLATNIYVNSDITMLGWISGTYLVGIYESAVKVYTPVKRIFSAIFSATIPRIAYMKGQENDNGIKSLFTDLLSILTLIVVPASIGLMCVSDEIIWLMAGDEYLEASLTLKILSGALIGAIYGGAITYSLAIPLGKERVNVEATMGSALINVGLNIILIPKLAQNGAAITTMLSELFVPVYCLLREKELRQYIEVRKLIKNIIQALIGSMSIVVISLIGMKWGAIRGLISTIILSIIAYGLCLIVMRNEYIKKSWWKR